MKDNWTIFGEPKPLTYGGSLRRSNVFNSLAHQTEATILPRRGRIRNAVFQRMNSRLNPLRRQAFAVATGLLETSMFAPTRETVRWMAVDLHDHPVLQVEAMQVELDEVLKRRRMQMWSANTANFETLIVPSRSFAHYAGLSDDRLLVIPNGTALSGITPVRLPNEPVIGMASGAARGRGIEDLIAAAERARVQISGLKLHLWLAANSVTAEHYVHEVRTATQHLPWVQISSPTFLNIHAATSEAALLVIPHPPNAYMDVALPIKLFDAFAVARPVLSTPRTETAQIIRAEDVGWVTEGDGVEALADAIVRTLQSTSELKVRGDKAWALAQSTYSWSTLSDQVANALVGKAALPRP